ncbi:MAG: 4Fe-4S dicluster domain-containing protein [Deltaproteobacteria bacterium]|nr:4Fe-4S dicluster domain-containing protein [Deltaproteobacteria bacterium]
MSDGKKLTRRHLMGAVAAGVSLAALGGALRARAAPSTWLRPPGALPEDEFLARCIRCFRCGEVCPPRCIEFPSSLALAESDTPYVIATDIACTLCMRCGDACPTGALVKIEPRLDVMAKQVKMGTPVLDKDTCFAWNRKQPCHLCFDVCPWQNQAVRLVTDRLAPEFIDDKCVGCGLCSEACPVEEKSIRIERAP